MVTSTVPHNSGSAPKTGAGVSAGSQSGPATNSATLMSSTTTVFALLGKKRGWNTSKMPGWAAIIESSTAGKCSNCSPMASSARLFTRPSRLSCFSRLPVDSAYTALLWPPSIADQLLMSPSNSPRNSSGESSRTGLSGCTATCSPPLTGDSENKLSPSVNKNTTMSSTKNELAQPLTLISA